MKNGIQVKIGKRIVKGSVSEHPREQNFVLVHVLLGGVWASWEFARKTVDEARTRNHPVIV